MIKVITKDQAVEPKPFPKLMIANKNGGSDTDMIVLFAESRKGTVIKDVPSSSKRTGFNSEDFIMSCFEDYNEPITIQNV